MSEHAATRKDESALEPTPPDVVKRAASADGELKDGDLDKVAGGIGPAPMRKAGKGQHEY